MINEPFIVHKKGKGWKFDESEADAETYLSKGTELRGDTDCFEAHIKDSRIENSYIFGANITDSNISSTTITGPAKIEKSVINCRSIAGGVVINNSGIFGESRIFGRARVVRCGIENLTVCGDAFLHDWLTNSRQCVFDGKFGRIASGTWHKPPRVERFDDLQITVTESTENRAFVGCIEKELNTWLKYGREFGRKRNWTLPQVIRLEKLFETWAANPLPSEINLPENSFANLS